MTPGHSIESYSKVVFEFAFRQELDFVAVRNAILAKVERATVAALNDTCDGRAV